MGTLAVDASVLVKWYAPEKEENLEQTRQLYKAIQNFEIRAITSDLLIFELGNALLKGKRHKAPEVQEALSAFFQTSVELIPTDPLLIDKAVEIAERYQLTVYDAIYVALAKRFGCQLLTANPRCHSKVENGTIFLLKDFGSGWLKKNETDCQE